MSFKTDLPVFLQSHEIAFDLLFSSHSQLVTSQGVFILISCEAACGGDDGDENS